MTAIAIALGGYVLVSLVYWLWQAWALWRMMRDVPRLGELDEPEPAEWPRLSVVVPARNEEATVEAAARSLLADDYPDLELVFVDDRSTDATGEILDRLAAEDGRVRAVHVAELPAGWLGKVHALQQGLEQSTGELALFTDADVHFTRGALRKAVAHLVAEGLDHVAALPNIHPVSLPVDAAVSAFVRQFISASRPWKAADPGSRAFLGIGAFNLVRRAAFDETEGFEWLRMEVGDDMGVGLLMKRAGERTGPVVAFGQVGLQWQTSLGQMARNAEKGYGSVCHFSLARSVVLAVVSTLLELSPLLAPLGLIWPATRWVGAAGLAVTAAFLLTAVLVRRWHPGPVWPVLLGPLTSPVSAVFIVRTAMVGKRRGGATWRGTVYTEKELRQGLRIRFP